MSDVHPVCARFRTAIELLGARWSGAVLRAMFTGAHRFADLKAAIPGISDVMLTRRLRELEDAGLVERQVIPTSPVHVEYHLTEMGQEAGPVLDAVITWSHRWIPVPPGAAADDRPATPPDRSTPLRIRSASLPGRRSGERPLADPAHRAGAALPPPSPTLRFPSPGAGSRSAST